MKINFDRVRIVVFFALLLFLAYGLANAVNSMDYDLWVRFIQGKHVVQTGSVMYKDLISYTPTHTWYDPEWLSSTLLYLIVNKFGAGSITVIKALLLFLSAAFVCVGVNLVYKHKFSSLHLEYFAVFFFLLFAGGSAGVFLRCQLFSYVLVPVWIILLEKISQNYDTKKALPYLIALPLLMLFWLNLHGACIAGAGLLVLYIIGRFLNKKPIKKYLFSLFFVFLAFFINPYGYKYIQFLFDSSFFDRSWIMEWYPLWDCKAIYADEIKAFLILCLLLWVLKLIITKFKDIDYSKLLLLAATYYLSWAHFKHIPLFVLVGGVYLYNGYIYFAKKVFDPIYTQFKIDVICQKYIIYLKDVLVYCFVFGISLYHAVLFPFNEPLYRGRSITYPYNVVEFIRTNKIKGNMFLPYFYGSYMAYKTYPNIKIFMDGRQEQVYDYDLFDQEMFFMYGILKNTKPIVEKYVPDLFLLEPGWAYNDYVMKHPDYKKIYGDEVYSLYIKKELAQPSYKPIRRRYGFNPNTILETDVDFSKK